MTLSLDLNFFTDRDTHDGLVPSELDTTAGLVVHLDQFDVAVIAENDRPVDRGGLRQSYVSALATWHFDLHRMVARGQGRAPW